MKKLGLLFVVAISLIFTVSCVNKEIPITETYYETAYRTESYVEIEKEQQSYIVPKWKRDGPIYFEVLEWAKTGGAISYYDGYEIDTAKYSKSQARLILSPFSHTTPWAIAVVNLTGLGPIREPPPEPAGRFSKMVDWEMEYTPTPELQRWLDSLNAITTDPKYFLSFTRSEQHTGDIIVDVSRMEEFMITTCVPWGMGEQGVIVEKVQLISSGEIIKERQVTYQVEKQRTVMQTKKVPFWEAIFRPAETEPSITKSQTSPATIIIDDDFSDPNSGWGRSSDDWSGYAYEEGEYSISIKEREWYGYHLNSVSGKLEDFTVEVDAKKLSQGTDDAAGIVFRDQRGQGKDSFYVFWVDSNSGTYAIHKYINNVWAPDLKDFTPSNYINRGANTNRLKVACKGSQIEVYANDYKLATVIDTSLTNGFIGLAVETFTSSNAHYHFNNFKLYTNN